MSTKQLWTIIVTILLGIIGSEVVAPMFRNGRDQAELKAQMNYVVITLSEVKAEVKENRAAVNELRRKLP